MSISSNRGIPNGVKNTLYFFEGFTLDDGEDTDTNTLEMEVAQISS